MMIFDWIIETSFAASIIVLIVICIRGLIKKRVNPNILYYMWFVVIIKLLIPNGPESNISIYNVFSKSEVGVVERVNEIESTNIINEINVKSTLKDESKIYKTDTNNKIDYIKLKAMLCCIWVMGIGFLSIRSIYSYNTLQKYIQGKEYNNYPVESILLETLNILCIKRKVKIIMCDEFQSPTLFGIMEPRIIIPKTIIENSTSKELKYILLHELIHLKRRDNIIIWVLLIIKIIYWFNPIITIAIKLMQQDCELACDANVLNKVSERENIDYGMAILKVLSSINSKKTFVGTTTMIRNKNDIKERISMISINKKYGFKALIIGSLLIGIVCSVGLTTKSSAKTDDILNVESIKENSNELTLGKVNSGIVVYNSHYDEDYMSGLTVIDAGEMLVSKLKENGLEAKLLKNTKTVAYVESYNESRNLVIEGVENYEDKMLIDIHRPAKGIKDEENRRVTKIILSKTSPKYEENKIFADTLINKFKVQGLVGTIVLYEDVTLLNDFNQDLSSKAIMLEVGSGASNKSDIEFCIQKISKAIEKLN
ncbi:stage II sporulation protein P [Clostridium gasigenes]|uniref:M56 family metallopeptidase n=1 Tax=Clostridium gasigenes TaxID=94869 RepID=UPI00162989C0|nr:M56 family metallopeptidase [Clostridium gasigenes]MBB6623549.1 stage II sporulation protein P [Clostridium gasigenes]MBU3087663.1 stage II sporulation protein P [Clostridium gasigenes]